MKFKNKLKKRMNKKAEDFVVDFFAILLFIIIAVVFFLIFKFKGQALENSVEDVFVTRDANIILQGLLKSPVYEDINNDGTPELITISELIIYSDDAKIMEGHIKKIMDKLCVHSSELKKTCAWSLTINKNGRRIEYNDEAQIVNGQFEEKRIGRSQIFLPGFDFSLIQIDLVMGTGREYKP